MGLVLLILLGFVALWAVAYCYVGRRRRPAPPADMRRADVAQLQEMPTADQVQGAIDEALGETRPLS